MKISKRHKRLSLRTRVVDRITDIPADHWNGVFPDVLESYDFFRTLDESNLDQFDLQYIMVYKDKKPVAATSCFVMNYSLDTSINGPLRRVSNSIKKIAPNIFSLKTVICGMPLGQCRIGMDGEPDAIMKALLRRVERIARKNKALIVAFKDLDEAHTKVLDPIIKKEGFTKMDSLPTTELDINFSDFDEYMKTLSYANRYDLRRKFKKIENNPAINVEIKDSLEGEDLTDVYKLYLEIVKKHDMGFELLPMEFFSNISKNMPGKTKFFLYRVEGKMAAFLFCLVSGDLLIDYYVGLDYSIAYKYHLYFVKFRDTLNWCIKNNIKKYEMGITGYEPKRRLGFEFIPLYIYAKPRNAALRPFFNLACQFLKFENFDPALKKAKERMTKR